MVARKNSLQNISLNFKFTWWCGTNILQFWVKCSWIDFSFSKKLNYAVPVYLNTFKMCFGVNFSFTSNHLAKHAAQRKNFTLICPVASFQLDQGQNFQQMHILKSRCVIFGPTCFQIILDIEVVTSIISRTPISSPCLNLLRFNANF